MNHLKIKKNDTVVILSGKDKGKQGKVLGTVPSEDKVVVEIKIPEEIVNTFSIGPHLKGVANYLLKSCNGRYNQYLVGKRLLVYTEIATPDMSDNRFPLENRLEAVAKFAKLLERSDEEAMEAISRILVILKDTENRITQS